MDTPTITIPDKTLKVLRILTSDISAVMKAVPTARPVQYYPTGQVHVDVDWTYQNMVALSDAGQPALSTIFFDYRFAGKLRPFYHQLKIAEFLSRNRRAFCLAGMGTGKTISTLYAIDYLLDIGEIKRVLVVCPKSLMYSAWADDIGKTIIHRPYTVLYGDSKRRKQLAMERDTPIDIINYDGIEILQDVLVGKGYDLIVIDESTAYKDPTTKRWRAIHKLVRPDTRLWLLTGSPTPQGAMDAYGQVKLCRPDRVPATKTAYRNTVQYQVSKFIWRDKRNWQDQVKEFMQPAVYIRKSDCLDLPPVTRSYRQVELSKPQKQAVEALRSDMVATFSTEHTVRVANAAVLHGKLRQIYSGAVYADRSDALVLDNSERINETIDLIKRAKASADTSLADGKPCGKALVFAPFQHVIGVLERELSKEFNVAVITGDTSVHDRASILRSFQTEFELDVIIAIPEAFSHGVTATAASLTVWYAPPSRTETYLQACERMDRPGQTQQMNIVHLYGDATERKMYDHLQTNRANQDTLLTMYDDFINGG